MQKGRETTKMVDSTIKGTTYEGESREKKCGIYEKRKLMRGERGRKIENKRVEEKIRREKRKERFSEER